MRKGHEKQTQKEGYKYAHIQRQTDRQRNNRIMRELHELGAKKPGYHDCSVSRSQLLNTTSC